LLPRYYGLPESYPRIRRWSAKLADYLILTRPLTLLGAWAAGFFLDILFTRLGGSGFNLLHALLIGSTLALLQGGGQALNQSIREELLIDVLNGKTYRPVPRGRVSLREGKLVSLTLFTLGVALAAYINLVYGVFAALIAFFAAAYTAPPFRVKRVFLLNNLWQGVARGMLPAVYAASTYPGYGLTALLFGAALALWVTGAQATKDFGDEAGDKAYGVRTFPVVLGRGGALKLMAVFMALGFTFINLLTVYGCFPTVFLALNVLILPSAVILLGLKRMLKVRGVENNLSWILWYGTLGLFYALPALLV